MVSRAVVLGAVVLAVLTGAAVYLAPDALPVPGGDGCQRADVVTDERPPVRAVEPSEAFRPARGWADEVVLAGAGGEGLFHDVAADDRQLIAVGRSDAARGNWWPLVASSADGVRWQLVESEALAVVDAEIVDVEAIPRGWLAVGSVSTDDRGGSAGAVWWSADGGRWHMATPEPVAYIHQIAVGDQEVLARASDPNGTPLLGRSSDGLRWEWESHRPNGGSFAWLAWAEGEWVAAGSIGSVEASLPAVWRSEDGETWSCRLLATTASSPFGAALRVHPGARTTLLFGHVNRRCDDTASCAAENRAWIATDGGWEPIGDNAGGLGYITPTVAPDGSFWAVNTQGAWRSEDGGTWELEVSGGPDGVPGSLAVAGQGLVAVGAAHDGARARPWLGLVPTR